MLPLSGLLLVTVPVDPHTERLAGVSSPDQAKVLLLAALSTAVAGALLRRRNLLLAGVAERHGLLRPALSGGHYFLPPGRLTGCG